MADPDMKIVGIVQARMSSTRLPGKVLKPLAGRPMLERLVERLLEARLIDGIVIATSDQAEDDPIEVLARETGVGCFRGSMTDVLDRYYQAACRFKAGHVVRITGDCPLIDPEIIDAVLEVHLKGGFDYSTNTWVLTYPDGLDTDVMQFSALEQAWLEAQLPSEREHVTPYIRNHPEIFSRGEVEGEHDYSGLRWTVDEPEDYEFVSRIYDLLHPGKPTFGWRDVLSLLEEQPQLNAINTHISRNEGYEKSLKLDQQLQDKKDRGS